MKISANGINLIKQEEGFRPIVYCDLCGKSTIGFGHKVLPGEVFPESGITEEDGEQLLLKDLLPIEDYLTEFKPILDQNQFDALCDFGYNLGLGSLIELLSHGIDQVPVQILRWDHAGGVVVNGLLLRRQKELELWEKQS